MSNPNKSQYFPTEFYECQCSSPEHTLAFSYDDDAAVDDLDFIYAHVFLSNYDGFFKRLWTSIKYLFGYKCRYGHWDEFIMREEDMDRLMALLSRVKDLRAAKKAKSEK